MIPKIAKNGQKDEISFTLLKTASAVQKFFIIVYICTYTTADMADPVLNTDPSADLFFPLASQPDIVRASQKDEYYKRVLYDKYYEIVQRIMGTLHPRSSLNT